MAVCNLASNQRSTDCPCSLAYTQPNARPTPVLSTVACSLPGLQTGTMTR